MGQETQSRRQRLDSGWVVPLPATQGFASRLTVFSLLANGGKLPEHGPTRLIAFSTINVMLALATRTGGEVVGEF